MITRKPWGHHICLRCQRALAKPSLHAQSPALSQESPERRRYSQQTAPRLNDGQEPDADEVDPVDGEVRNQEPVYARPLGKLRGHRGIFKREDLEELRGATTLGDQAKVIVLRDSIFSKYALDKQKIKKLNPKHIDILGRLSEERGLVETDEVTQNIDAFRPAEGDEPQDFDEINELVRELQEGFTMPQLAKYIKDFEGKREEEKPDEIWKAKVDTAPLTRITPWQPGFSEIEDYFENDPLRGYFLGSHTAKQRLILRLLRECWMLELPELVEGIGQFEVQVRNGDLDLLLLGPNSVLDIIHATHLSFEEERLEVFRSRSAIRVTTTHAKKFAIVDAIQESVKGIRRGNINLSALLPRKLDSRQLERFMEVNFNDAALEELGDLTRTRLVRRAPRQLQVSCIESNPDAASSRVDVVRRLILTCNNFSSRLEHELAIKQKTSTAGALMDYAWTEGLSWRQQQRPWKRFTAPISKEAPSVAEPVIEPELSSLPRTQVSTMERAANATKPNEAADNDSPLHWSKRYFTATSALMGTVLHSPSPHNPDLAPNSTPMNTLGLLHTFSTKVPNLSRVLSKADARQNNSPIEHLKLRFLPDPFYLVPKPTRSPKYPSSHQQVPIGVEVLSAFPSLEMSFDIEPDTREPKLKTVNAIVQETQTDVMLPENAIDVRFQQRITSRLTRKFLKPIKTFLAQSKLNLGTPGKLDTPPSITLPISSHLCRDEGFSLPVFKLLGDKQFGEGEDEKEVRYLFSGLEIHSTLIFEWKSFRVLYTSIEAGKAGGRRAELKLRPIKNGRVATEADFVAAAYRLADMLGDGTGEHVDLENVKSFERTERQGGFMRSVHAKTSKPNNLLFSYFSGKLKLNQSVDGDAATWEEIEDLEDEGEGESDGVETGEGEKVGYDDGDMGDYDEEQIEDAGMHYEGDRKDEMLQQQHDARMERDRDQ